MLQHREKNKIKGKCRVGGGGGHGVKFMEKYIREEKCRVSGGVEILRNAFAEISVVDKTCPWKD